MELPKAQMEHTTIDMIDTCVTEHLEVIKELVKREMPQL
jgi:hypothetical protein